MIPYGRHFVDDEDVEEVVRVLRSDWLTQGPEVEEFEAKLCHVTGAAFAVAFSSATAGLHAAAAAGGIGTGDVVATSALSFVASANCARYMGARVAFVDIEAATLNLDVTKVPACDALVAVHYAGLPVDLENLPQRPRVVIEDAAHAIGSRTPSGPVGNCAHSDMTVFSFHPVKTITTAEGGAVTTNSRQLADALRSFRSHGIRRGGGDGPWWYDVETLGFNYRLSDIHAALGRSQLRRLDAVVERRNELAQRYRELLAGRVRHQAPAPVGWLNAHHLFVVRVPERRRVYEKLHAAGIAVQVHYVPIYRHSSFGIPQEEWDRYPETERAYAELLSLPLYPTLTNDEQDYVVTSLLDALEAT